MHMSPALNGSSPIWRFEHRNAIKILNRTIFDFDMGQPHMVTCSLASHTLHREEGAGNAATDELSPRNAITEQCH